METNVLEEQIVTGSISVHLSPWELFTQADIIVQLVMLILIGCSFWSWAIIFDKVIRLRKLSSMAEMFEERFWSGGSLDELYEEIKSNSFHPMAQIFVSAMKEWKRFSDGTSLSVAEANVDGLQERIAHNMNVTVDREIGKLQKYLGFLATVGSTAPFIGLFGTVWGIMNSFQSIAASQDTSLAVVAPGIAEALFATALGLVAAIPAVVAYNKISSDLDHYAGRLDSFGIEFRALISRQLEEGSR
ncbi:MAG: protein TolQ [Alphaproteobacteria bacterium]|nr:protein TolQ [Alphaproteobacteria bacterium]|tara:strand:+ start:2446 stop:3180 length:735 start_codon:yes stop_codon:yes gene_type:complete